MTQEDHVFVANVVVTDPMQEKVPSSVISRPTSATTKLNAITKICKYKGLHEWHHFILMAMEVHSAPRRDMDCFIRECAHLFHDRRPRGHLSFFSFIQFFKQCVSMALERKIVLAGDACSRPPITSRSHDLRASDIRRALGEIASYQKKD
jgi:hypothetical protein